MASPWTSSLTSICNYFFDDVIWVSHIINLLSNSKERSLAGDRARRGVLQAQGNTALRNSVSGMRDWGIEDTWKACYTSTRFGLSRGYTRICFRVMWHKNLQCNTQCPSIFYRFVPLPQEYKNFCYSISLPILLLFINLPIQLVRNGALLWLQ